MVSPYESKPWATTARESVESRVLTGPDCPARRFLLEIQKRRAKRPPQPLPTPGPPTNKPMKDLFDGINREIPPPAPAEAWEDFAAANPVEEDDNSMERHDVEGKMFRGRAGGDRNRECVPDVSQTVPGSS